MIKVPFFMESDPVRKATIYMSALANQEMQRYNDLAERTNSSVRFDYRESSDQTSLSVETFHLDDNGTLNSRGTVKCEITDKDIAIIQGEGRVRFAHKDFEQASTMFCYMILHLMPEDQAVLLDDLFVHDTQPTPAMVVGNTKPNI